MKTLRLASAFPLWRALRAPVTAAAILTASMTLGACADENDPKTWVKRLDEQSQRALAIKTLDDKFNAAMSGAGNNREDPKVKGVVDDAIEALTKTYVTGGLDDKTRKDLMKLIADMGDPRSAPALSKAFRDYEPGTNDEDVL